MIKSGFARAAGQPHRASSYPHPLQIIRIGFKCLITLAMTTCALHSSGAFPITIRAAHISLAWDPPPALPASSPEEVASYRIYIRRLGSSSWQFIAEVPEAEAPKTTIDLSDFRNGFYELAVSAVSLIGMESSLHCSTDLSADPSGGWMVNLVRQ